MNLGVERRLTDDMSELDIQLQKQTEDISIKEMLQETENMKKELQQRATSRTEQNQIGE